MSRAAYDLQVLATAHSASCGHPGFVPDDYLEHLDGLASRPRSPRRSCAPSARGSASTAATASWTGKRVEYALDQVASAAARILRHSPGNRNTRPRSRPAWPRRWWSLRRARHAEPPSARIELVAPGQLPAGWDQWPGTVQASILRQTRARTVVPPGQRHRHVQRATAAPSTPTAPGRSPGRSGLPCASPRSTGRVLRRCRILPRLRRPLLLPALAPLRHRIRLLPPRARQGPGPALVAVNRYPGHMSTARTIGTGRWTCDHAAELGFHRSAVRVVWWC